MTIISILLGLIGLGIMVFVHELGHFVAAKANGGAAGIGSRAAGRCSCSGGKRRDGTCVSKTARVAPVEFPLFRVRGKIRAGGTRSCRSVIQVSYTSTGPLTGPPTS